MSVRLRVLKMKKHDWKLILITMFLVFILGYIGIIAMGVFKK